MRITDDLATAFREHRGMDALAEQLRADGHLAEGRGLTLDGDELTTSDEAGDPLELPESALAAVAAFVPPDRPPVPPAVAALEDFKDAIRDSGDFTPAQKRLLADGFAAVIAALGGAING